MSDIANHEECPNGSAIAMRNLPALLKEQSDLIRLADQLAARVRLHHAKATPLIQAAAGVPEDAYTNGTEPITFEVSIRAEWGPALERALSAMQAKYPAQGMDDCLADIVELGIHEALRVDGTECVVTTPAGGGGNNTGSRVSEILSETPQHAEDAAIVEPPEPALKLAGVGSDVIDQTFARR